MPFPLRTIWNSGNITYYGKGKACRADSRYNAMKSKTKPLVGLSSLKIHKTFQQP